MLNAIAQPCGQGLARVFTWFDAIGVRSARDYRPRRDRGRWPASRSHARRGVSGFYRVRPMGSMPHYSFRQLTDGLEPNIAFAAGLGAHLTIRYLPDFGMALEGTTERRPTPGQSFSDSSRCPAVMAISFAVSRFVLRNERSAPAVIKAFTAACWPACVASMSAE